MVAKEALHLQTNKNQPIGIVGLDLSTRRRNRLNGNLNANENNHVLSISVEHSFGNCPKYIQSRHLETNSDEQHNVNNQQNECSPFIEFNEHDIDLITQADTLFIASSEKQGGSLDANHRGGKPGFIHIDNNKQFWFKDYPGNNFFQTFGNIHNYPNIGLMLIDFNTGDLLLMHGKARLEKIQDTQSVESDSDSSSNNKKNSKFLARRLYFSLDQGLRVKQAIKGQWSPVEMSPFLDKI